MHANTRAITKRAAVVQTCSWAVWMVLAAMSLWWGARSNSVLSSHTESSSDNVRSWTTPLCLAVTAASTTCTLSSIWFWYWIPTATALLVGGSVNALWNCAIIQPHATWFWVLLSYNAFHSVALCPLLRRDSRAALFNTGVRASILLSASTSTMSSSTAAYQPAHTRDVDADSGADADAKAIDNRSSNSNHVSTSGIGSGSSSDPRSTSPPDLQLCLASETCRLPATTALTASSASTIAAAPAPSASASAFAADLKSRHHRSGRDDAFQLELVLAVSRAENGLLSLSNVDSTSAFDSADVSAIEIQEYLPLVVTEPLDCTICWTEIPSNAAAALRCPVCTNSVFHDQCLRQWSTTKPVCPSCKRIYYLPAELTP